MGAAIIEDIEDFDNIFYIDKFVVEKSYQGNGLGTALWNAITDKYKKLIWRASLDNPAKDFYEGKYDDMKEKNAWNIYYKGLNDVEDNIDELIDTVAKKEATMIKT
ncbi:MAG: GNAT family N-acetyltransferase [Candidatus Aenigmarchaeota archaeon]|nr:GNAT family N-acetyltransferase [Candidatus Aenigmarchaeota archaeon]